ncbi:MAG: LysE family transporter [Desulfobacterales bacterium]|jgi:threonine/homoserine/homoserine lactone efflux protein|nr:LysE family transporter [Desulfobacterales bacterium]
MLSFLITGTILGLSAGFAPGPLLALVISETMEHGVRAGIKVALAPILTDLPIIIVTIFILAKLSDFQPVLGIISIIGALFILYLGINNLRTKGIELDLDKSAPRSFQKGIIVNALSPHPYLFWFSVGGPITIKAMDQNLLAAISFIGSFYVLLLGTKIVLAILVGKSRTFLMGNRYIFTMRLLGFILILLAGILFRDGLHLLDIL